MQDAAGYPSIAPMSCSREEAAAVQSSIKAPSPPLTSHQVTGLTTDLKVRYSRALFKSSLLGRQVIRCKAMPCFPTILFFPCFIKYLQETLLLPGLLGSYSALQSHSGRAGDSELPSPPPAASHPHPSQQAASCLAQHTPLHAPRATCSIPLENAGEYCQLGLPVETGRQQSTNRASLQSPATVRCTHGD